VEIIHSKTHSEWLKPQIILNSKYKLDTIRSNAKNWYVNINIVSVL
jgi:hypothetical protein